MKRYIRFAAANAAFILFSAASFAADDLTEAQLKEIIAKAHSPILSVEQLRIFPCGRVYDVTGKFDRVGGPPIERKFKVDEKWVDGKYVVSEFISPGVPDKYQEVIRYDEETSTYRTYMLSEEGLIRKSIAQRVGQSRSLAGRELWSVKKLEGNGALVTATYTDSTVSAHSSIFQNGELTHWEDSTCTVVKMDFTIAELLRHNNPPGPTEFEVAVKCGKAEDYLQSEFAIYRECKRLHTCKPERVANGRLCFKLDDSKNPESAILSSDIVVQIK